ncbi:MAG: carboxypeptidase-like regulatory domain-containing protein [Planctomycetes bacterium]|nr:carboxypeptidase-like regulatory domain-containing protein [Planctomycetota bacterium]
MATKGRLTTLGVAGLALALAGCCGARLRGVVSDEATGAPVSGAVVQCGDATAQADELGFYDLEGLSCEDCWRVSVSAPGYHLLSTSVVPAPGEDPTRLVRDLALVPLSRPSAQPERGPDERPRAEDYLPRHASVGDDKRLYIKLTEEQTRVLLEHMKAHGGDEFARALRALIESLPQRP